MNLTRLKLLPFVLLFFIVFSCQKEEEPPYIVNNSVYPVDFLSDKRYKQLVLEVVYVDGLMPTQASLDNLVAFLGARLNKPSGITTVLRSTTTLGRTTVDASTLRDLEKAQRQRVTTGDLLTAWLFVVDAEYASNTSTSKVLGVAFGASSMAVFGKTVDEMSGGFNQPSTAALETTILEHEFGHILGLVNNGTSMAAPHQDTSHSAHCSATTCLMYYKTETHVIAGDVLGKGVPVLDDSCLADLKAAGGK